MYLKLIFWYGICIYYFDVIIKNLCQQKSKRQTMEFPKYKLVIMAVIDTLQFALLALSAVGISSAMTVILFHANTPCVVFGSYCVFPARTYTKRQMLGVTLIVAAILISVSTPILYSIFSSKKDSASEVAGVCSMVYVCAAAMQGLSTLYKEKAIITYAQPLDIHQISAWLFYYQFCFSLFIFPLLYLFQGKRSMITIISFFCLY